MIHVENLSKTFSLNARQRKEMGTTATSVTAVDNLSFNCQPGRVSALLGPNGAGKTTTLRMLSTIFTPTSGKIEIDGIDAIKNPEEARRRIGFLTGSAGLDVITAENIIQLINDCKNQGKTVIFSSHIMSEVDLLCDDISIIYNGKLLFNDTMEAFRQQMQAPNLTAEFIRIVNASKTTVI